MRYPSCGGCSGIWSGVTNQKDWLNYETLQILDIEVHAKIRGQVSKTKGSSYIWPKFGVKFEGSSDIWLKLCSNLSSGLLKRPTWPTAYWLFRLSLEPLYKLKGASSHFSEYESPREKKEINPFLSKRRRSVCFAYVRGKKVKQDCAIFLMRRE